MDFESCSSSSVQPSRPYHGFREFVPDARNWKHVPSSDEGESESETVFPGILCAPCTDLWSWLSNSWDIWDTRNPEAWSALERKAGFPHHKSGAELEASFRAGCHLCTHLFHSAVQFDRLRNDEETEEEALQSIRRGGLVRVYVQRPNLNFTPSGFLKLRPHVEAQNDGDAWEPLDGARQQRYSSVPSGNTGGGVMLDRLPSPPWTTHIPGEDMASHPLHTASPKSFQLVRDWIRLCTESHLSCRQTEPQRLPTRLLRVFVHGSSSELATRCVQLVEMEPGTMNTGNLRYAALSYCWGTSNSVKLTRSTHKALLGGIPAAKLAKTLEDAVHTTLRLGLEWLWVDSLCIFQDALDDWTREAATMYDTYQGSFITIAALGASDSNDGLYARRDPLQYAPCPLLPQRGGSETIWAYPDTTCLDPPWKTYYPLHTRGWVFQERILPPRTVKLGPMVAWECREVFTDDLKFEEAPKVTLCGEFHRICLGNIDQTKIRDFWTVALKAYSRGQLSVKTDRLSAISGIISGIQKATGWDNMSGLWLRSLMTELVWWTHAKQCKRTGLRPTWSWISVDGVINSLHIDKSKRRDLAAVQVKSRHNCDVTSDSIPQNTPPTLQLSCIPLEISSCEGGTRLVPEFLIVSSKPNPQKLDFRLDLEGMLPQFFVPLFAVVGSEASKANICGIGVIRSQAYPGCYERVGFAESDGSVDLEDFQRRFLNHSMRESLNLV